MSEDLIKRSDAIKAIEELPNAYNGWSDTYDKAYIIGTLEEVPSADIPKKVIAQITFDEEKLREIVKEAVERFKQEYEITDRPQEWIPCKERLPREYEVLCCDIYRNCIVGHPFADDSVSTGFCAENEGEFLYECVAWMPLPEPWEGADDE